MDILNKKIKAAEQSEKISQLFLSGDYKRKKTIWETVQYEQTLETPLSRKQDQVKCIRPEIIDIMDIKDAKRSSKLFE